LGHGWNRLVAVKITAAGKSFRVAFNAHGADPITRPPKGSFSGSLKFEENA
jgi:hypothetical protein